VCGPLLGRRIASRAPAGTGGGRALVALERERGSRADAIAAFVLEPRVQGAAGMLVHPAGFLSEVARMCRANGVHLIVDEVATGFGRTGVIFACEDEQVSPDFLCTAKGLAGVCVPLAGTL